jgi:hypothetical protein
VQRILDSMTGTPAFVQNGHLDVLYANQLGYALYSEALRDPGRPANFARFVFLDPRATEFYVDWESVAATSWRFLGPRPGATPTTARCPT